jgi:hypothetical protein
MYHKLPKNFEEEKSIKGDDTRYELASVTISQISFPILFSLYVNKPVHSHHIGLALYTDNRTITATSSTAH